MGSISTSQIAEACASGGGPAKLTKLTDLDFLSRPPWSAVRLSETTNLMVNMGFRLRGRRVSYLLRVINTE